MIESNIKVAAQNIKSLITSKTLKLLKEQTSSGAKVLGTKLKAVSKS